MDDRLRQQLAAWLEFYRDLGIEDFFRRVPRPASAVTPPGRSGSALAESNRAAPAAPMMARGLPWPAERPVAEPQPLTVPSAAKTSPTPSLVPPGPPARSLSLFEAPPPLRRERETLEQILAEMGDCQRCRLAAGRKTIVFGQGNPHAALVFVGEAPGADEDEQGLPFVGRAGQLLNRLIQFMGMKREEVYICNVIKCRPPQNRTPQPDEIETCSPFLFRQIEAIQPRLVCCLGAPAVRTLLGIKEGITKIRGRFYDYGGAKAFVTFHPAYILRNPREEGILREDFERVREFLRSPR